MIGGKHYEWYVLAVLSVINLLNYADRSIFSIVLQSIKRDFNISDTVAGLLTGLAFAVVYSSIGIPLGRIADRGNRVRVLAASLAVWTSMTMLCGLCRNAVALFFARMGVGVGEAGGLPSIQALVAEYFSPAHRSAALSIVGAAAVVGAVSGILFGGILNDRFGWRATFIICGTPGLIFFAVLTLTVKEPRRTLRPDGFAQLEAKISFARIVQVLWRRPAYCWGIVALTFAMVGYYAQQAWTPSLLIRCFGLKPGQVGPLYVAYFALPTIIGTLGGGVVADYWFGKDQRAYIWMMMISFGAAAPACMLLYMAPSLNVALLGLSLYGFAGSLWAAPSYSMLQALAGRRLRATAFALFIAIVNITALSIGPLIVGLLSDVLVSSAGVNSIRWALLCSSVLFLVSIPFLMISGRTLKADIASADRVVP